MGKGLGKTSVEKGRGAWSPVKLRLWLCVCVEGGKRPVKSLATHGSEWFTKSIDV